MPLKELLAIASFFSGIFILFLGLFVFLKDFKKKLNLFFLFYCISISIWLISTYFLLRAETDKTIIFWDRMVYLGVVFIPIFGYHFGTIFVGKEKENKKTIYFGYLSAFIFFVLSRTNYFIDEVYRYNWGVHTRAQFFHHIFLVFFSFYIFLFFYEIYKFFQKAKKEKNKIKQMQAKYIFLSFMGFAIGSYAFLPAYGIDVNPLGAYFGEILATTFLFFAILKYHLFEIKVILTELLVGVMWIILLILPFVMPTGFLRILTGSIFILFCVFGYYLVKAIHKESKRREEAEKLVRGWERLARTRRQILLSTQHYFRTPLTAILGYLDMILDGSYGKLSEKAKEKLALVKQSATKLQKRIEESLDVTQFQLKKALLEKKETQIEDLIREVIKITKPIAEQKHLWLKTDFPKKKLPKIEIDPQRMKEVFSNLIENAIKHTIKGGMVIGLKSFTHKILFWVRDTGIGIPKQELPYIGSLPFERGKEAKKLFPLGKGLGLYLSKQIVKAHGGKLWAESEGKDKGSTFFVELPTDFKKGRVENKRENKMQPGSISERKRNKMKFQVDTK